MLLLLFNQAAAGVSVNLGGVAEPALAGGVAVTPGTASVALGGVREIELAGGLVASVAGVALSVGGVAEADRIGGLAVAPGAVMLEVGGAREVERAGGLGIQPGAATVAPGGYAELPGISMPHFREMADVVRRAGIYGPRDYLKIVEDQIRFWAIETLTGLDEIGRKAQEKICSIPARLERVAEMMETRSKAKAFSFAVAFGRAFEMA